MYESRVLVFVFILGIIISFPLPINKSKIGFNVPFFEWIKSNKKFRLFVIKQLKLFKKTPFSSLIKIDQLILKINSKKKITIIPGIEMLIWQITNLNMWLDHPKNKFIKRIYK